MNIMVNTCVCRAMFSTAEARVLELEDQMRNIEEAKAAAEAAVEQHLALRKEQTERIRKAKAGGVKGELSTTTSPTPTPTPTIMPLQEEAHALVLSKGRRRGGDLESIMQDQVYGGGGRSTLGGEGGGFSF